MEGHEVTHYQVLGISKQLLDDARDALQLIRHAYRRALLRNHPDKATAAAAAAAAAVTSAGQLSPLGSAPPPPPPTPPSALAAATAHGSPSSTSFSSSSSSPFTIDQITAASAVLSDPRRRREYDTELSLSRATAQQQQHQEQRRPPDFQTGIETLDLDDLDFDEEGEGRGGLWYRSCRCGNPRGFLFGEDDLEAVAEHGELIVGCQDCSLWLKVHFAVLHEGGVQEI